eukprot:scaffold146_cov265-Pinguiococcus_pyrenoidosus.AAC.33
MRRILAQPSLLEVVAQYRVHLRRDGRSHVVCGSQGACKHLVAPHRRLSLRGERGSHKISQPLDKRLEHPADALQDLRLAPGEVRGGHDHPSNRAEELDGQ